MTDRFEDGKSMCSWGHNKVLCCIPVDIDAFSSVNLTYLFLELPPFAKTVKSVIQNGIESTGKTSQPAEDTWGMLVQMVPGRQ